MNTHAHEPFIVDVRTNAEYSEMHLPDSLNIPLSGLKRNLAAVKDRAQERPVLLVCRSGKRAAQAEELLHQAGIANTQVMEGGILACLERGEHLNRSGKKVMSLERQVRIAAGGIGLLGSVLAFALNPWFLVIPAFIGAGQAFSGITDSCALGMMIARMPWNQSAATCPPA
ncbi:MAG: rhodanese-like domain-containing protein [Candidatus Eisenbacteria bacterium]|uniref:Rhodanese-like domain-containing protein n=1 Tax=Eiseniibacteriota bacterium TaxID=2212470 RepID=A0A7Y2E5U9_UNCEI|nr:rhodanese-like domain-containing protein [Candidatus Eisenbacteria bacterium]